MANSYFKFKHFIVHQDLAAMKVGTDAVLLGAWADIDHNKRALDIGSGTGLISLMLAQRNPELLVDAVEIDKGGYEQSVINFESSAWSDRLHVFHLSFQNFCTNQPAQSYDLIVSNPPFFTAGRISNCKQKSMARHTHNLSFVDLITGAATLLKPTGKLCVILPAEVKDDFIQLCLTQKLFLNKQLAVKPTPTKAIKRVLLEFTYTTPAFIAEDLLIVEEFGRHHYSDKYKELTKEF